MQYVNARWQRMIECAMTARNSASSRFLVDSTDDHHHAPKPADLEAFCASHAEVCFLQQFTTVSDRVGAKKGWVGEFEPETTQLATPIIVTPVHEE
jgi:hypothetical protein